jgi:outer membrane receptor protein involved in Fe transport
MRLSVAMPVALLSVSILSAAQSALAADDSLTLEEIVVSAQKRGDEQLQNVPISISVLGGDDLDRSTVEGIAEALNRVPGVSTSTASVGGTQLQMRGVTAGDANFTGSGTVAYYLDSVSLGLVRSAVAPDLNAYDLDRVEVARGPQGTLYGASALNGVVRVLTKDANPDEFELKARALASSTEGGDPSYRGDMAVNVPIVSGKLAARAVLGYQDLGGWIDKPTDKNANDAEIKNMRLKIQAQPTDQLSIGLSGWLSRADYGALSNSDDNFKRDTGDEPASSDTDVYALNIGYDFDRFSVSSVTSSLDYTQKGTLEFAPGLPYKQSLGTKAFAQEVILNSTDDGSWRWTAGGFYRDADERFIFTLIPVIPLSDSTFRSESFAVFGEVTKLMLDGRLELTAGLRYFEDKVRLTEKAAASGAPPVTPVGSEFDAVTPRAVLTWHPSDELTIYTSYGEGFRSGFNQGPNTTRVAPDFPPVGEDTLKNYELGAKGSLWDDRVRFDAAVYFIDWQDVQQTVSVPDPNVPGSGFGAVINGSSASGTGADFSVMTAVADGLELGLNFGWNDLTMDRDVLSGGVVLFKEGDRLNQSPEYTVGASADYGFPVGRSGLWAQFSASANYISEQENTTLVGDQVVINTGDEMLIARLSLAIRTPDERWAVTLFADNINNEGGTPLRDTVLLRDDGDLRVRPRTLGVQVDYRY